MTGPVVCGIDFSDDARRALRWAAFMADHLHQPLIAVHAVDALLATTAQLHYGPDALATTVEPDLQTFVAETLGATAQVRTIVGIGEAAGMLSGTALAEDASLIVVATQGLGAAGRLWFGSTTTRLLRESTRPVLAIPPGDAAGTTAPLRLSSVIVGTDFGAASAAAVEAGKAFGTLLGVRVTALHAVPMLSAPTRWSGMVAEAIEMATRNARAHMEASVPTDWISDVRSGDPAEVLVEAARGQHALIVVGLGGTSPAQRPGTTAYRVLSDADGPVLAVPPG
jgi:nucleotide-binding universal stress UspA family protein